MSVNEQTTTRSGVLGRLLLLAGGAVGVGVAGDRLLGTNEVEPEHVAATGVKAEHVATAVPARTARTLVLEGRDWHVGTMTAPGELPGPSDRFVPSGRFVDSNGKQLGTFGAAALATPTGALELHTFDLDGDTILGLGPAGIHDKPFAIVGGTGRYAGASGTYVARQSPRELGGDGSAAFTLNFVA